MPALFSKKYVNVGLFLISSMLYSSGVKAQSVFTVDANRNSISASPSSSDVNYLSALLDTGIDVKIGDSLIISATGSWTIADGADPYTDANGQIGRIAHSGTDWPISSLLAQISNTPHFVGEQSWIADTFVVGTDYNQISTRMGRLFLAFNDTDFGNNNGSVQAKVTVTAAAPEPGCLALLVVGLAVGGGAVRRRTASK